MRVNGEMMPIDAEVKLVRNKKQAPSRRSSTGWW